MSEYRDCRKAVANAKPYPRSQWCESIGGEKLKKKYVKYIRFLKISLYNITH